VALGNAQSQRLVDNIGIAYLTFITELILARERERGLIEITGSQQKTEDGRRRSVADLSLKISELKTSAPYSSAHSRSPEPKHLKRLKSKRKN